MATLIRDCGPDASFGKLISEQVRGRNSDGHTSCSKKKEDICGRVIPNQQKHTVKPLPPAGLFADFSGASSSRLRSPQTLLPNIPQKEKRSVKESTIGVQILNNH